jgi:energy-coupling factor transporter ATP-binding protein EcfA2
MPSTSRSPVAEVPAGMCEARWLGCRPRFRPVVDREQWRPGAEISKDTIIDTETLLTAATELCATLRDLPLSIDLPGADEARVQAASAVRQLEDYVLPRLRDVDAPVLTVVGGSTGAGKSTLVNSLVGAEVSRSGVLRPTTRAPVLIHNPKSEPWFADDRILPGLARVRGGSSEALEHIELVARDTMPETLALLDAPDIDSVVDANRAVAAQLLDAADLWLFVTTAARYADAVPWTFLRVAVARGVGIGLVLNRVPPGAAVEIGPHFEEMLRTEGLGTAPTFTIEEQPLVDGRLPADAVQPIKSWIGSLAADQHARSELVRRTLLGTISELAVRAERVAVSVEYQDEMLTWLGARARDAFARAMWNIAVDVRDGTVMRGEVLARWQDVVGTGELLRSLQSTIGRLRDRIASSVTGRPRNAERFQGAVTSGVETVVLERVAQAIDETVGQWRSQHCGAALITERAGDGIDLTRPSPDLAERTQRMVRDWQAGVMDLLRRESAGKQTSAKVLSYGVNGVALVLMVGVFSQTGGLTGAEVVIAGGSSAVGQRVLEALLGDQAVRRLTAEARTDLERRVGLLVEAEEARFDGALAHHRPSDHSRRLRELSGRLRAGVAT